MRTVLARSIVGMFLLAVCCGEAAGDAASAARGGVRATAARYDACALLSLAQVRRILPEAGRSERNDALASEGISACSWYGSRKSPELDVSVWDATDPEDTPMDTARTLGTGLADPTRPGAARAVRFEQVADVGDGAVAVVETANATRGILSTAALLAFRKNGRIVTVAASEIAVRDRAATLRDLSTLGPWIAARL